MPCVDTDPDPNLSDQCISINDGPGTQWWMSPDINLNGFTDIATIGSNSTVDVTVHRAAAACNLPAGTQNIIVEVWVSSPGLNLSPLGARNIDTKLIPVSQLPAGGPKSLSQVGQLINWTPASTDPMDSTGHACLIARCYPDGGGQPQPDCFHVVGDRHVAQRNINIVKVRKRELRVSARIRTGNSNREEAQSATLRVVADLRPDRRVLDILMPGLQHTEVFQRVARSTPAGFALQLPDFPNAKVRDYTRPGCLGGFLGFLGPIFTPRYEADVRLNPGQVTDFNFTADLSRANSGDAYIFYLTHQRSDKRVIGGLTLVAVVS